MFQAAVFVDAGYLFAQGSTLLTGSRVPRQRISLDPEASAKLFCDLAANAAPGARLLRIYWYDGLIRGGSQTAEHVALGRMPNMKLRLGLVNSRGEQKGVDALIVTDLIDLARNRAISDAVILSGDEDIRIGVQIAQTFGVRVRLAGIKPALGSQSPDLVAEADSHVELGADELKLLLSIAELAPAAAEPQIGDAAQDQTYATIAPLLATEIIVGLDQNGRAELLAYVDANRGALPPVFDRPSLARLRDRLGRDVADDERKLFRTGLRNQLRSG